MADTMLVKLKLIVDDLQFRLVGMREKIFAIISSFILLSICRRNNEMMYCRREDFFRIPELAINPLGERIVQSFFASKEM